VDVQKNLTTASTPRVLTAESTMVELNLSVQYRIKDAEDYLFRVQDPAETPIVLRAASADVLHGLHVAGTNIGTQVVPGYVSQVHTKIDFDSVARVGTANADGSVTVPLFCNEYCGLGHQSMWGRVRVTRK
jgi:cytochrome c oxidase subunit 2